MKTAMVAVETAEIATEMIAGANASIVITMMKIQTSSQQDLSSQGTAVTKLTDDPMIIVTIEIVAQMTAETIETIVQMIEGTVETTDATTAIPTEGQNGAGEQTKSPSAQSKKGWMITADSIFTKQTMVSFVLTTRCEIAGNSINLRVNTFFDCKWMDAHLRQLHRFLRLRHKHSLFRHIQHRSKCNRHKHIPYHHNLLQCILDKYQHNRRQHT